MADRRGSRNFFGLITLGLSALLGIICLPSVQAAAPGLPLWTNFYNGPVNSSDTATAAAVDRSGNVFVTGGSNGSGTSRDYATVAYSGAGVALWTNRFNGPGNSLDEGIAITVDGIGNVLVTGFCGVTGALWDYATIKYAAFPPPPVLTGLACLPNGSFQFAFTNLSAYSFTALAATNVFLEASNWTVLGPVPEIAPGQFQFTDTSATNLPRRFYRIRSP